MCKNSVVLEGVKQFWSSGGCQPDFREKKTKQKPPPTTTKHTKHTKKMP